MSAAGYSLQAELTPSGRAAGDAFGESVALSARGTTALVGADFHNLTTGAAYVFTLQGGAWSQTAELTAPRAADEGFGNSVALSAQGTTALVGQPGNLSTSGAAYVFTLQGRTWSQTAELTATHPAAEDQFGGVAAGQHGPGRGARAELGHRGRLRVRRRRPRLAEHAPDTRTPSLQTGHLAHHVYSMQPGS